MVCNHNFHRTVQISECGAHSQWKTPSLLILINTFPLTEYLCLLAVGYGWERNHDAFSIHQTWVVVFAIQ